MVRKDPNPRSGDLGNNFQGVPCEFLVLIWILNVIGLTPPLHIPLSIICEAKIWRVKPKTLEDLIEVVKCEHRCDLPGQGWGKESRERREASKWGAAISIPNSRNTREDPFRSKNIAWSYEAIDTFVIVENWILLKLLKIESILVSRQFVFSLTIFLIYYNNH